MDTSAVNTQLNFPLGMPVDWQKPSDCKPPSSKLADWLLNTGSLTERLEALCSEFSVDVLGQAHVELEENERLFLEHEVGQTWQVREVILKGDGKQWVYARSILPQVLCEAELSGLGNKPLGKRIFNDPEFVRSDFEIGPLNHHPLTGQALFEGQLYARRSLFSIGHEKLLVAEAFLPDCPCYRLSYVPRVRVAHVKQSRTEHPNSATGP